MIEKEIINKLKTFNKSWRSRDRVQNFIRNKFVDEKRCKMYRNIIDSSTTALMCPNCFNYFEANINYNLSVSIDYDSDSVVGDLIPTPDNVDYIAVCKQCGKHTAFIEIDKKLANAVSILNKKGYKTQFCCSGHTPYDRRLILFDSVYDFSSFPKYWNYKINDRLPYSRSEIEFTVEDYVQFQSLKSESENFINVLANNGKKIENLLFKDVNNWAESLPQYNKRE